MQSCRCFRRLRYALVFHRRLSYKHGVVFVTFLVLLSLLHTAQVHVELTPRCRVVQADTDTPDTPRIWPLIHETDDRIQLQLAYKLRTPAKKDKLIYTEMTPTFEFDTFENDHCAIDQCRFSMKDDDKKNADVLIYTGAYSLYSDTPTLNSNQATVLFQLESPSNQPSIHAKIVNWTATYRLDATIVTPYEKFVHFDNFTSLPERPSRNYALGKTKKVAWFVSNCGDANGRLEYAKVLQRYIPVDIYGNCGPLKCPRNSKHHDCNGLLRKHYKFYLSFENSNCRDYITEKLYWNAYL